MEEPRQDRRLGRRYRDLVIGLLGFGVSIALMAAAGIGMSPWETFHQGLARVTGLPMGTVSILVAVPAILLWLPLGARPGPGTFLNMAIVGTTTNLILPHLPHPEALPLQLAMFGAGLAITGVVVGLYLAADLGPGPRDGLFTALHRRTGWRIAWVRTGIEAAALGAGWLLGGKVGLGTIVLVVSIGPITERSLKVFDRDGRVMRRRASPARMEVVP
jgi:uncharacterized membrane protein YczE